MREDDTLDSAILAGVDARLLDVHTQLRGTVVSYDETNKTCVVELGTKRAISDGAGGVVYQKLPNLLDVPVAWPSSGGFVLHWPLPAGSSVFVTFDEQDSQRWEDTGQASEPGWLERFGLSSALAHPYAREAVVTTGACMVCPSPFSFGDSTAAKAVAIAEKVEAQLSTLKSAISGAAVVASDGGAAFKANILGALSSWPASTAATKLKAE